MEDLSLHILDIAENSIAAGATTIEIAVEEYTVRDLLRLEIKDNGRGMDEEMKKMVADPFFTTKTVRKVGLGLPFLKQAAIECDGSFSIASTEGKGTTISATFKRSHIDRKPLGDMAASIMVLIAGNPHIDFVFQYRRDDYHYHFDTREIREDLDGIPINRPDVLKILRKDIDRGVSAGGEQQPSRMPVNGTTKESPGFSDH
jgi:anti-sigma regulatory factor (Ser/Thr protein kinase)